MKTTRIAPTKVKPWEADSRRGVVKNPNLVKLNGPHDWQPIPYVSYLWLLVDQKDLRVGIETQAAVRRDESGAEIGKGMKRQGRLYGHPTLANPGTTFRAFAGGELLYKPSEGGWIINRESGRYGVYRRDKSEGDALMYLVRHLFKELANVDVRVSTYKV